MQGRPHTGIDPDTGNPGVAPDQTNYYSPIADINLLANGFRPAPRSSTSRRSDDYFPPPHGQYSAFLFGAGFPLQSLNTRRPSRSRTTARASRRSTATSTARRTATRSPARCSTSTA
jgi:hypothetical protein